MAKKKEGSVEEIKCENSNGNVFTSLGVINSEEELTKAKLVWEIEQIVKERKWTQAQAARVIGISQPKISALMRRKLDGFSIQRLIYFLNALDQDVDIVIKPKTRNREQGIINVLGRGNNAKRNITG